MLEWIVAMGTPFHYYGDTFVALIVEERAS